MYHIYDRNPYICIVPSLGIVALFCEFVLPHPPCPVRLPLSLNYDFLAVSWGLVNQSRDLTTPAGQIARNYWSCACFSLSILQVPINPLNSKEKTLT